MGWLHAGRGNVVYQPTERLAPTGPSNGLVEMLHRQLAPGAQAPRAVGAQGPIGVFVTGGTASHRTATTRDALVEEQLGRLSRELEGLLETGRRKKSPRSINRPATGKQESSDKCLVP